MLCMQKMKYCVLLFRFEWRWSAIGPSNASLAVLEYVNIDDFIATFCSPLLYKCAVCIDALFRMATTVHSAADDTAKQMKRMPVPGVNWIAVLQCTSSSSSSQQTHSPHGTVYEKYMKSALGKWNSCERWSGMGPPAVSHGSNNELPFIIKKAISNDLRLRIVSSIGNWRAIANVVVIAASSSLRATRAITKQITRNIPSNRRCRSSPKATLPDTRN